MLVHDSGNGVINARFKLCILIYDLTNAGLKFIPAQIELGDCRGARVIFKSAFSITMVLGILSTRFTFFTSGFLAAWGGISEAKLMFICNAPTFRFSSISCVMHGHFQGHHNMAPSAMEKIRSKYGYESIRRGIMLTGPALDLDAKGSNTIHPMGFLGTLQH